MAFCEGIPTLLYNGASGAIARHIKQSLEEIKASQSDMQKANGSIRGGQYNLCHL
jgi:hypothetical protein